MYGNEKHPIEAGNTTQCSRAPWFSENSACLVAVVGAVNLRSVLVAAVEDEEGVGLPEKVFLV